MTGEVKFDAAARLKMSGWPELKVTGFSWSHRWEVAVDKFSIGLGIGGLTAELVLRTLDGEIHRIFSNRDLVAWTVDENNHRVVPRPDS